MRAVRLRIVHATARRLLPALVKAAAQHGRHAGESLRLLLTRLRPAADRILADSVHAPFELLLAPVMRGAACPEADVVKVTTLVEAVGLLDLHALRAAPVRGEGLVAVGSRHRDLAGPADVPPLVGTACGHARQPSQQVVQAIAAPTSGSSAEAGASGAGAAEAVQQRAQPLEAAQVRLTVAKSRRERPQQPASREVAKPVKHRH
mmetsp:Transcript_17101/g.49555  ORF Transcript_17101/g.49555 Transcript_17101/m.49555 type:complete len:205 (-) Transcript_17101:84-698(-)